jgi:hypothetical protein
LREKYHLYSSVAAGEFANILAITHNRRGRVSFHQAAIAVCWPPGDLKLQDKAPANIVRRLSNEAGMR